VKPKRFIVLDRDGTIIVKYPYLSEPDKVELIPGAAQALRELRELGFGLVVVTNQSAIGRGYLNYEDLQHIHERLVFLLQAESAYLDGIYFCPHTPEDDCLCRKPKTGLLELASQELGFEYKSCIVIGDNKCDIELGRNVKALTILVRTGEGSLVTKDRSVPPDYIVDDIREAVWTIRDMLAKEQLPS
jgi:D-glycero-D-manno-heptose 1,7-bisphosphate phosphatase